MVRPRNTGGRPLPANMYIRTRDKALPENEQRFRYKLENGTFKPIKNSDGVLASYDEAVIIAEAANAMRGHVQAASSSPLTSLSYWLENYIEWAEKQNPLLKDKTSWRQRTNEMKSFVSEFMNIRSNKLALDDIEPWWDELTYDQQHNRRAAFSKWFLWMLNKSAVKSNPFANSQDRPCLIGKPKPSKSRMPLDIAGFWAIYHKAGELQLDHVQIAMGIALVTMMRESDICELQFDLHIVGGSLKKSINKSVGQRGSAGASHLEFKLNEHLMLNKLINRARELSLKHQRCPYILSYKPKQKRKGKTKTHTHQVTPRKLIEGFAQARDATGLWAVLPSGKTPPTFHEIKGDSIYQAKCHAKARGYSKEDISNQAAHTDGRVTDGYTANHEPNWQTANVIFDEEMIGGSF